MVFNSTTGLKKKIVAQQDILHIIPESFVLPEYDKYYDYCLLLTVC